MTAANETAYACFVPETRNGHSQHWPGLTKRELFAAMCLQGLLSSETPDCPRTYDRAAVVAVMHADALIAALNKEPTDDTC